MLGELSPSPGAQPLVQEIHAVAKKSANTVRISAKLDTIATRPGSAPF